MQVRDGWGEGIGGGAVHSEELGGAVRCVELADVVEGWAASIDGGGFTGGAGKAVD